MPLISTHAFLTWQDAEGRRPLAHYLRHPLALEAGLSEAHVIALRWYTTDAFASMVQPLQGGADPGPHPLAATVAFVNEALHKLRFASLATAVPGALPARRLWRAVHDVSARTRLSELLRTGATLVAPLSCTPQLELVAPRTAPGRTVLLLAVKADDGLPPCGTSLSWLSTRPHEHEFVCPPCAVLAPTGRMQTLQLANEATCIVVEVQP